MSLKEIMHKPTFVDKDMTIREVAKIMAKKSIGSILVGSPDNVLGIFSERDMIVKVVAKEIVCSGAKVRDYMTSPIKTVNVNMSIFDAQNVMIENHIRRLPIIEDGKVIGIVSARNIMENLKYEYLKKRLDADSSAREPYSTFW